MNAIESLRVMDLHRISRLREELLRRAHFFDMELKQQWVVAERQWREIEEELRNVVAHSQNELGVAAALVAAQLRETYVRLRQELETQ